MDLFNGVGDDDGITVDAVRAFLYENRENDVRFRIDSLGGNLAKGLVIHNLIKSHHKLLLAPHHPYLQRDDSQ
jgi:ATP-dependent protease ClpP protease subunit